MAKASMDSRDFSPKARAPEIAIAVVRANRSPILNWNLPPLEHSRYRPNTTTSCRGRYLKLYFIFKMGTTSTGAKMTGKDIRKPTLVAEVHFSARLQVMYATAIQRLAGRNWDGFADFS
ncbi:MAG TPA: hypothetical protein PKG58_07845, partial [Bacillota bacterium]|nr:hypothetical protein [Bacillota bacterium]